MTDDLRSTVLDVLLEVAPEVDPATVEGDTPLQEQLDLDSMDFLSVLEGVAERTGVEIPEDDYAEVRTLDGLVTYLRTHAPV